MADEGPLVLVVDDDDGVRTLSAHVLRSRGYRVVEAANGTDALQAFDTLGAGIDLLITDVVMPDIRGPALAARLREVRPELPVLFISGYQPPGGLPAQAVLLAKPVTPIELAAKVKELLIEAS